MSKLQSLEAAVARDLAYLGGYPDNWVAGSTADVDVVIVGAGHSGQAIAFGLQRAGIRRLLVVDAAARGRTGALRTKARMRQLRTPKGATGPELGIASLSFRAWFDATHPEGAFEALDRIPLDDWNAYFAWYEQQLGIEVQYETALAAIDPQADGTLALRLTADGQTRRVVTRKLILATGAAGSGQVYLPADVTSALPPDLYAHTDAALDFSRFAGKRVAVLGAGASAFDAAIAALEAGAQSADLLCRKPDLNRTPLAKAAGYAGAATNFSALPDPERWQLGLHLRGQTPGPPRDTVRHAVGLPGFRLHLDAALHAVSVADGAVRLDIRQGRVDADFLILGTGYRTGPAAMPLLAGLSGDILTWGDRVVAGEEAAGLLSYPYLGTGFEFLERHPGAAPWLGNVHCFNYGATLSFGRHIGDIPSLAVGVPQLIAAVSRDLFVADGASHVARILSRPEPDYTEALFAGALVGAWPKEVAG